jgi:hypothetical protein
MQITIIASPQADHQKRAARALKSGFDARGHVANVAQPRMPISTRHVACWGWRRGRELRAHGHDVLVIEHGYIGDRSEWLSLGWNGLNNRATFAEIDDPSRFNTHFADYLQPENPNGDYVLLIGQVDGDMSLQGQGLQDWYVDMAFRAESYYGLPVRFRPHPVSVQRNQVAEVDGAEVLHGELDEAITGAAVVVTYNSNTGVESVLAGKQTIAFDKGSMARDVSGHDIGETSNGDRELWAHRLAWKQWRHDEIASGEAVEVILHAAG